MLDDHSEMKLTTGILDCDSIYFHEVQLRRSLSSRKFVYTQTCTNSTRQPDPAAVCILPQLNQAE